MSAQAHIEVRDLTMAYGSFVIQRDINFTITRGDIFIIMGGSGCGKSTLLRQMVGLKEPAEGQVFYDGVSFWDAEPEVRERYHAAFWNSLPERRFVELHNPCGKRCPSSRGVY